MFDVTTLTAATQKNMQKGQQIGTVRTLFGANHVKSAGNQAAFSPFPLHWLICLQ